MMLTREIVLDLLPLVLSGEARRETVAAVEAYLKEDPELAQRVAGAEIPRLQVTPRPLSKEAEMEAYKKANWVTTVRTIVLAALMSGMFLALLLIVPLIVLMFR